MRKIALQQLTAGYIGMKPKNLFVSIETAALKEKLNRLYVSMRQGRTQLQPRHFQDLWDLKELAMMESSTAVLVPASWLEEVEMNKSYEPTQLSH